MVDNSSPTGVEVRNNSIRIVFTYRNQRCRETLRGLRVTQANLRYAARKREAILYEIERGSFDYVKHFPDSPKGRRLSDTRPDKTIGKALDEYLLIKAASCAASTVNGYASKANSHIRPRWGSTTFRAVTQTDIDNWIAVDLSYLKNKTINEILSILRALFAKAKKDKIISELPDLDSLPTHIDEPDPFTRDEITRITGTHRKRTSELNCIEFALWSGLRVSELLALGWDDIDSEAWEAHIRRARVRRQFKRPKTRSGDRIVELITPAIEALHKQHSITAHLPPVTIEVVQADNKTIRQEQWRPVFINSNTGQPFPSDNYLRDRFLSYHLKKCEVRYRGPKHCRHTYASQMLTLGMPKEWIARQMGHSSVRTLERRYAKWIKEDQMPLAAMASKLLGFGAISDQHAPNAPQDSEEKLILFEKSTA